MLADLLQERVVELVGEGCEAQVVENLGVAGFREGQHALGMGAFGCQQVEGGAVPEGMAHAGGIEPGMHGLAGLCEGMTPTVLNSLAFLKAIRQRLEEKLASL